MAPPGDRKRRGRLSRSGDFNRVYRDGRSHSNRYVVLYAFPRENDADGPIRLGLSVSRKVGGAVERSRVKRALREGFWSLADGLPAEHDFVLVARADLAGLVDREGTNGVAETLASLLSEAGIERSV